MGEGVCGEIHKGKQQRKVKKGIQGVVLLGWRGYLCRPLVKRGVIKRQFIEREGRGKGQQKRNFRIFRNKVGGMEVDGYFCTPNKKRVVHFKRGV